MNEDELIHILSNESKVKEESEEQNITLPENIGQSDLTIEYLHTQIDRLKEDNAGIKQDRGQRKIFGYIIFGFMCLYMVAVLVLVYMTSLMAAHLSDTVLITLLTTSLASVIGVFNFVAKYLFPNRKDK